MKALIDAVYRVGVSAFVQRFPAQGTMRGSRVGMKGAEIRCIGWLKLE